MLENVKVASHCGQTAASPPRFSERRRTTRRRRRDRQSRELLEIFHLEAFANEKARTALRSQRRLEIARAMRRFRGCALRRPAAA